MTTPITDFEIVNNESLVGYETELDLQAEFEHSEAYCYIPNDTPADTGEKTFQFIANKTNGNS